MTGACLKFLLRFHEDRIFIRNVGRVEESSSSSKKWGKDATESMVEYQHSDHNACSQLDEIQHMVSQIARGEYLSLESESESDGDLKRKLLTSIAQSALAQRGNLQKSPSDLFALPGPSNPKRIENDLSTFEKGDDTVVAAVQRLENLHISQHEELRKRIESIETMCHSMHQMLQVLLQQGIANGDAIKNP